jgi:hypothetical protein
MNSQLHQTTLSLISLIHVYQRISGDNEKIRRAMTFSQLLKMDGAETSSEKEKLQFCSDAAEAITSVVNASSFNITKTTHLAPLLERDEIDFIQDMLLSDDCHESEHDSNYVDYKTHRHYGT